MRRSFILLLAGFALAFILVACSDDTSGEKKNNDNQTEEPEDNNDNEDNDKTDNEEGDSDEPVDNNDAEDDNEDNEEEPTKTAKYEFERPDTVRGIYLTGHSAGGERFGKLIDLVNDTDLNSMVIDIKDDAGYVTYEPDEDSEFASAGQPYIKDPEEVLKELEKNEIYPIARIVVFKDSVLAEENPDVSFKSGDEVWVNNKGEAFVSPFQKDVWEYNLKVAKEAAEMGFKDIQFDYVRFPEGFETRADNLSYDKGDYSEVEDGEEARVKAVTDFVAYAEEELADYDVDVSVDIFGYTAAVPRAPGIGQDLVKIGEHIDVLSSMIYPSHWGAGSLDIEKPDLEPYETVFRYAEKEKEKLFRMDDPPISRPWIQDFTASWLGSGNYLNYGKDEVESQIRALNESGIDEFLIWNSGNEYSENTNYKPPMDDDVLESVKKADEKLRKEIEAEQEAEENGDEENDDAESNEDEAENNETENE